MISFAESDTCKGEQATSLGMNGLCLGKTGTASKLIAGTYDVLYLPERDRSGEQATSRQNMLTLLM
jgi:hypothetical protein